MKHIETAAKARLSEVAKPDYTSIEDVVKMLNKVGLKVGELQRPDNYAAVQFSGNEAAFKQAIKQFMAATDWKMQNPKWFPGDPGSNGEKAYYIMDASGEYLSLALSFDDMTVYFS